MGLNSGNTPGKASQVAEASAQAFSVCAYLGLVSGRWRGCLRKRAGDLAFSFSGSRYYVGVV